jgi:nitrate reductase assembly molybdenum cofactor insertion protein NarJ
MLRPIGLLAPLVEYPDAALADAAQTCVAGFGADPEVAARVAEFAAAAAAIGLGPLEELYVDTFELRAEATLHLGHHLFGEDVRRNVLLTRLKRRCVEHAIDCERELPDHLGIVLRLAAVEPPGEDTHELLQDCLLPTVKRIARAIAAGRVTPYGPLFGALAGALERQLGREGA